MSDESEVVETAELVPFDNIAELLFNPDVVIDDDPERNRREIVQQILDAETADEVLADTEVTHARDYLGIPFNVLGFNLHTSAYADGPGVFAAIDAASMEGEKLVLTCGAVNVIAQLYRLAELGQLPRQVMLIEKGTGKDGKRPPMKLVAPPKSF